MVPEVPCPYTVALEARLSHDRFSSGTVPRKRELSESVEPGGASRLSLVHFTVSLEPVYSDSGPLSSGLVLSLTYKVRGENSMM